jgi:ankyrin repeat protein
MEPQDALFQLAKQGDNEDLTELLGGSYKVNVSAADSQGNTALHYAAAADHAKSVSILIAKGATVDARNKQNETPLHRAAARGSFRSAKFLVSKGASLEAKDNEGNMPRSLAQNQELRDLLTPGVEIKWDDAQAGSDDDST